MTSVGAGSAADAVAERIAAGEAAQAARVVHLLARHTPLLTSRSLSEGCGGRVVLKAENLQRTGSFKLRGAVHKLSRLHNPQGVTAGSAGNHAQSLAYAARARGIPCEGVMPSEAPAAKAAAADAARGLSRGWVEELVLAGEDDIAEAMVWLMERSKLVVEGGGAIGVAALLSDAVTRAPTGSRVFVLSGGNVDAGLLAFFFQRPATT